MMKEEELKPPVACNTDHLLKSKRENKGKAEQLECNYELIKHSCIYIHARTHTYIYIPTHRYLAATSMKNTTKKLKISDTYSEKHTHSNTEKSKL